MKPTRDPKAGPDPAAGAGIRNRPAATSRRGRRIASLALMALVLTGCTRDEVLRMGMPVPITVQGQRIQHLFTGTLWAAVAVGAGVLTLIVWAAVAFRRRDRQDLPRQVHYNVPVELLYTVVPFIIIVVLFYFTARDESTIDNQASKPADVTVHVVGFRWAWQFVYDEGSGSALAVTGRPGADPVLAVPAGKTVKFTLASPDVIHAFWVPNFIFKRDVIPGRVNSFAVNILPNAIGTYPGRCSELCGVYHDQMLFTLKVVSPTDYTAWLAAAKEKAATGSDSTLTLVNPGQTMPALAAQTGSGT